MPNKNLDHDKIEQQRKKISQRIKRRKQIPQRIFTIFKKNFQRDLQNPSQIKKKQNPDRNTLKATTVFWRDCGKVDNQFADWIDDIRYLSVTLFICFEYFERSLSSTAFKNIICHYKKWINDQIQYQKKLTVKTYVQDKTRYKINDDVWKQINQVTNCYIQSYSRALEACDQYERNNLYEGILNFAKFKKQDYYLSEQFISYILFQKKYLHIKYLPNIKQILKIKYVDEKQAKKDLKEIQEKIQKIRQNQKKTKAQQKKLQKLKRQKAQIKSQLKSNKNIKEYLSKISNAKARLRQKKRLKGNDYILTEDDIRQIGNFQQQVVNENEMDYQNNIQFQFQQNNNIFSSLLPMLDESQQIMKEAQKQRQPGEYQNKGEQMREYNIFGELTICEKDQGQRAQKRRVMDTDIQI